MKKSTVLMPPKSPKLGGLFRYKTGIFICRNRLSSGFINGLSNDKVELFYY